MFLVYFVLPGFPMVFYGFHCFRSFSSVQQEHSGFSIGFCYCSICVFSRFRSFIDQRYRCFCFSSFDWKMLALCCGLSGAHSQNRMWILQFQVRFPVDLFC